MPGYSIYSFIGSEKPTGFDILLVRSHFISCESPGNVY